jgi:putative ABC transport system substrate-binding protein
VAIGAGVPAAVAAKAATRTIPIVFGVGVDPVRLGLVASLNRPGGNVTGVSNFVAELGAKQLGLLHELTPNAHLIAMLVNPSNQNAESQTSSVQAAARTIGQEVLVLNVQTEREIDAAFETLIQRRAAALVVGTDAFLRDRRDQIIALVTLRAIPAVFPLREYSDAGGLMSYGPKESDVYRQVGVYAGRVVKGEKPAELPVVQSTRFELVVNLKTSKALGLTVPPGVLAIADEVIE